MKKLRFFPSVSNIEGYISKINKSIISFGTNFRFHDFAIPIYKSCIANNKESLTGINRNTIENVQLVQANKLFVCVSLFFTTKRNGITKKHKESQR